MNNYKKLESGRSMIEMLGVLAIIGVLSVGGIAGYSKAMEMYKMNKLVQEYTDLIFGLVQYNQNHRSAIKEDGSIISVVENVGLVPATWKKFNYYYLQDSHNNLVDIQFKPNTSETEFTIHLGGFSQENANSTANSKSIKLKNMCRSLLTNVIVPLHYTIKKDLTLGSINLYAYYGDSICENNCIRDLSAVKINEMCSICEKENYCDIWFNF